MPDDTPLAHRGSGIVDQAGWEELVEQFSGRMWAVARALGLSAIDAADAVQGAWLRMVENLGAIRDPDRIGAWLITTTRHEAARIGRRSQRVAETPLPDLATPDPAAAVVDADFGRHLWRRVDLLGEPCRSLLRLHVLHPDTTYAQIAMRLNLPVGSIGPTRARCMSRLRALVEEM